MLILGPGPIDESGVRRNLMTREHAKEPTAFPAAIATNERPNAADAHASDTSGGCRMGDTTAPSIPGQAFSDTDTLEAQNCKGGEKRMASEWEELEKLSKEELVIRLVKSTRDMNNLKAVLAELSSDGGSAFMYASGTVPSKEWMSRIADVVRAGLRDGEELCAADLEMYGVDERAADQYIEALRREVPRCRGGRYGPRPWRSIRTRSVGSS